MKVMRATIAAVLTLALAVPPGAGAQAQAGQHAGTVVELIPAVDIQRGAQQITATPQAAVFWQDVLTTARRARARVQLADGSVLNVGAESRLVVTRHDSDSRQTELELNYGRVRSQVTRDARPGASFRVRTPTAVAGVVGTDFFLEFFNNVTLLIVYSGSVELCDLTGRCVAVAAGLFATVRAGQPPSSPQPVQQQMAMQSAQSTQMTTATTGAAAGGAAGAPGLLATVAAVASVVVPAIVAVTVSKNADRINIICEPPTDGASTGPVQASSGRVCAVKP